MNRFGTPDRIALDVDVDTTGTAHLALWLGGTRLGAPEQVEGLATFLEAMKRWMGQVPPAPPEFVGQPADTVFTAVHALLNDPNPERDDFPWEQSDLCQRITLSPNGCAPFDGDYAFVLQEPGGDRVIYRKFQEAAVGEVKLEAGEVVGLIRQLLAHPWGH